MAVDETKVEVDGTEVFVWTAVDCETLEVLHVDVTPGRSSLDALLFLREVLEQCRGCPLLRADRGPWYDWPLELLDCEYERETWGNRSLIEAWFGLLKYRTRRF
ncbi:IS6 family transposase [Halonotius sp. F2-221B]|uniref:DDE-type integrase/transposase/recombinase n=1 Tax=Halonotius sp. F2-221B TaxID=2731620 RepID=UPI00398B2369